MQLITCGILMLNEPVECSAMTEKTDDKDWLKSISPASFKTEPKEKKSMKLMSRSFEQQQVELL